MKSVLVLGAGRSSSALIDYLISNAVKQEWHIVVGDLEWATAQERIAGSSAATAIQFNIEEPQALEIIRQADVVVSMLPAHFHVKVARMCLQLNLSLIHI